MLLARGKPVDVPRHAWEGMQAERPRVRSVDVELVLEEPDHDNGTEAWKRIADRTVIVRYREEKEAIYVRSVSATRSRLPP